MLTHKILRLLEVTKIINLICFNVHTRVNGKKFLIPFRGSKMGMENIGLNETWFFTLFQSLKKQMNQDSFTFIDIGMNIGQTVLKVKSIDENINYIGFEPNVNCVNYIHNLIQINKLSNIKIYPVGLAKEVGFLTLFADNPFASGATMIKNFRKNQKIKFEFNTPVMNGDFALDKENNISIIKIDVEGFELDVLEGMQNTLKKHKPIIICEVLPNYGNVDSDRWKRQLNLENLLNSLGYSIYQIQENSSMLLNKKAFGEFHSMEQTNYIFAPLEKLNMLESITVTR
jgi:FkbM family methyltransferase